MPLERRTRLGPYQIESPASKEFDEWLTSRIGG